METCHAVAEISYSRTCFGFKPKHKPTVDVLDEAAAAARVQQGEAAAVLWLDVAAESMFLTERWDPDDPVSRPVPLNVCVTRQEAVCHAGQQEVAVATLTFTDRASAELHGKLALSALPEWLSIRHRTAARSLLVLTDHWIVTEEEQALKLQHPEGQLDVLLRLNLQHGSIEAELVQEGQACKSCLVSCFGDVIKLLKKHSRPQQRLDKTVHTVLQELRPTSSSVGRLLARLEATVMGHKGAPSMGQWCRGVVMAALVDSAASLGAPGDSRACKASHRHSSSGHSDTPSSQPRHRGISTPGAAPAGQQPGSSTACLATLQALAECCCVVLQCAASGEAQAGLLAECVRRALMGSMSEAVCVLQLLRMVLRHVGASSTSAACMQLHQACCDKQLLHLLQHCYSMAAPHEEQQPQVQRRQQPVEYGLGPSHQLEGLSPDGASEPSTPQGCAYALPAAVSQYDQAQQAGSAAEMGGATEETPTPTPRSPAAFFSRRQSLVPKLHLPVPLTPAPNSASRLSVQSSARAAVRDSVSAAATPGGREAAAPSFVRALQQLGHSCGQSVMAADLAAFVTHKQLLGGVVAVEAALQHSRPAGGCAQSGAGDCSVPANSKLSFEQLTRLALPAQLQLELLEVLVMLAEAPGSELMLPKQWEHLLFSSLLVPKSTWLLHGGAVSRTVAGRESALSEHAYARIRALSLQLIACSSGLWHAHVSSHSQAVGGGSQLQPLGAAALHNTVLAQFLQRLVSCSSQQGNAGDAQRTHADCAELLLLLRDYLRASQQPQLADTACRMLGGVLGQQEHLLRCTRLEHWSLEAVVHMDALIQLYTQLLGQVMSPQAVDWLLVQLGVQASGSRPGPCSTATASPHTPSSVPADTLQLVLDFMQTHLAKMAAAADSTSTAAAATPSAAALILSPGLSSGRSSTSSRGPFAAAANSATSTAGLSVPLLAALQQRNSIPGGASVFVLQLKANCWLLLSRVLLLAACQPAVKPQDPLCSPLCSRELSSSRRGSTQQTIEGGGNTTPGPSGFASTPKGRMQASLSARGVAAVVPQPPDHPAVSPSPSRRPSLPLLSLPNSASRTPCAAMLTATGYGSDPASCLGTPQGQVSAQGRTVGSAAGRCSIWQVLVELLMVNSSMGQATVLQHMAETRGIRLALPLQHAVADFLSAALGTPDSYAFSKPQLAEFYVHHHFLHFTQHYHKLSSGLSTGAAMLCKSHLQVLLALCRQTGGAHQVRRRFLQLKVLEFLAREASLEYMCRHNQLAPSPSSSCCSTPLSTSRTAASRRTSARGATDPGWAGAAAAAAAGTSHGAVASAGPGDPPGLSLAALLASGGAGAGGSSYREGSVSRSARGLSGSRLWGSSPGSQAGNRPAAQNPQGSSRTKAASAGGATEGPARAGQQACSSAGAGALPLGQQQQQGLKLGSKVKAAVEALESAAAAVRPQLQPTPPKSGAPSGAVGRRQPGHQRLVPTVQTAAAGPQVPKLKLSHLGGPSSADAAAAPGSGSSPKSSPMQSRVAWQVLEPTAEEDAAAGGQGPALAGGHAHSSSSDAGSSAGSPPPSPRADILGYEVPASVRSRRRVKQPQLTGDASIDNIIIDDWERETGLEFQFDGLSDDDDDEGGSGSSSEHDDDGSDGGSSSDGGDSRSRHPASQPAGGGGSGRSNLRPQTPEVAFLAAAAPDKPWPALQLDLAGVPRSGRWISSSDTVEEATAAHMAQIVGRECLGVGSRSGTAWADSSDSSALGAAAAAATSVPEAAAGTAAAGGNQGGCKPQVPRLPVGGSTGAAAGASPAAASADPPESPGTYRPGFDLEEDFERLMAAGEWEDSDTCSTGAASARSQTPRSPQRHWQPAAALQQHQQQQSPPARQQVVPRLPPFKSQQQQQPCDDTSSCQQRHEPSGSAQPSASPDVQAHADVHTPKPKRHHGSKKQAVLAGSGRRVVVGPQAHALADMSGSSSSSSEDEGRAYGSDSDLDSGNSDAEAAGLLCRTSPHRAHAVVIPRLNLPQLAQPSWHLPTADRALTTGSSSDTGLSRSSYRTSMTSASRGGGANGPVSLTVLPLTTSRMASAAGADSSRGGFNSSSYATLGGPHGSSSCRRVGAGLVVADMLPGGAGGDAEWQLCTPSADGVAGGGDPSLQGAYAAHRRKCAVYMDLELHMLCIELALHLLVTPSGQLDPVQLPHEPSDTSLQRKVLLLLEHLSHPANLDMTCAMAQRACSTLQEQQRRRQNPLPLCSNSLQPTAHQQLACSQLGAAGTALAASGRSQDSSSDPGKQRQLQEACRAVWDDGTPARLPAGGGRGPASSAGSAAAADAAAGLAASSLRLLKLLCLPVLDVSSLVVGGMINKGAFSEVLAGTYRSPDGSPPMPVALKVIDCSEDDACSFERVYNEVASLESLRGQPCVVPLLEYGVTSCISGVRQWVLVFPRYQGSLREWRLNWAGRGLNTQELPVYLSLFLQVARAVAVLHASNVVHFDIKGDNVLLQQGFTPAGLDPSSSRCSSGIVLADFGDALMLENAHASSQRHRGTELFSSPEMLLLHAGRQHAQHAQHDRRKHRGVHAAHDVWSLGCTLYELLTGSVLFEDEGVGRITSYSSSQSSGGGAHCLRPDARGWGVLNAREKAALQQHSGCIELVESMLVGEPNWRPTADQVVVKTQRLLASLCGAAPGRG